MRLIDFDEFKKQFFTLETEFRPSQIDAVFDCLYKSEILDADDTVAKNAPTIDAIEVVHGEWIYIPLERYKEYKVKCPFCGSEYHDCYDGYISAEDFNYCPNCGAKMDVTDINVGNTDGERRES